jgi:hypothetical protein
MVAEIGADAHRLEIAQGAVAHDLAYALAKRVYRF